MKEAVASLALPLMRCSSSSPNQLCSPPSCRRRRADAPGWRQVQGTVDLLARTIVPGRLVKMPSAAQGELHGLLRSMLRLLATHPATVGPALVQRGEMQCGAA